jgi:putative polymerase
MFPILHIRAISQTRGASEDDLNPRRNPLASTAIIGQRRDQVLADSPEIKWVAGALIIGAISFNAVLCFLNTRGVAISSIHVMISEALLISAAVMACRNYLTLAHFSIIVLIVLFTITLSIIRYAKIPSNGFDPKISRDILIPVVFFLLGKAVNDIKAADRVVLIALAVVSSFAAFEYFFLDAFLNVFGVAEYYIARGTLEASDWALEVSHGLMASGLRPADQGRTLLPFLGDHRVSSLFLEPSTLGNFGALVTLWAFVRSRMEGRLYVWCALGGLALLALSDTRFNAYFLVLAVPILTTPPRIATPLVFVLPFIIILALYLFGASADPYLGIPTVEGLEVGDRLLYSGRVLLDFDLYNWLGLEASREQTFDSGYGYVISNLGIIGFAVLWTLFMSLEGSSRYFFTFRNVTAVYFAALLCISAAQFTIKIAALLWFMLGALSTVPGTDRLWSPVRKVAT